MGTQMTLLPLTLLRGECKHGCNEHLLRVLKVLSCVERSICFCEATVH